jgi:hypothetical protein
MGKQNGRKFLLEEIPVAQLVEKFSSYYGIRKYIMVFTTAQHWPIGKRCSTSAFIDSCFFKLHFNTIVQYTAGVDCPNDPFFSANAVSPE